MAQDDPDEGDNAPEQDKLDGAEVEGDTPDDDEPDDDEPAWPAEVEYNTALPPKMEAWRKRSTTGAILTGIALGLQQALETNREEPAIVAQTSGDPPKDLPVEAEFEFRRPRQSVVSIRPWLLDDRPASDQPDADPE